MLSYKNLLIGFVIFLFPLANVFKINNIKQFSNTDIYLFILTLIIVFISLIILSFVIFIILKKIFKIEIIFIFPLMCINYVCLFLYVLIHNLLTDYLLIEKAATYISLIIIYSLSLIFCFLINYFDNIKLIFLRTIYLLFFVNIILFFYNLYSYNADINKNIITKNLVEFKINNKSYQKQNFNHNIYYVILDAMTSLKLAEKKNIINKFKIKEMLEKNGLVYIEDSYSNYNVSYLTLQSLMELNYPITNTSKKYNNRKRFFPHMMYQGEIKIPLPYVVDYFNYNFKWIGNSWGSCMEIYNQPWECNDNKKIRNIMRISSTIFFNTPIKYILTNWLPNARNWGGQRNLIEYMLKLKKSNNVNKNNFVFIHQMSPHPPYNVNDLCDEQKTEKNNLLGYKSSYRCVLLEVEKFMEYISIYEPNAIVVFQGDHGMNFDNSLNNLDYNIKTYASIFNAIKAPQKCFEKYGQPHSNINTVRFVLNCAFGTDLKQVEDLHYRGFYELDEKYGNVEVFKFN